MLKERFHFNMLQYRKPNEPGSKHTTTYYAVSVKGLRAEPARVHVWESCHHHRESLAEALHKAYPSAVPTSTQPNCLHRQQSHTTQQQKDLSTVTLIHHCTPPPPPPARNIREFRTALLNLIGAVLKQADGVTETKPGRVFPDFPTLTEYTTEFRVLFLKRYDGNHRELETLVFQDPYSLYSMVEQEYRRKWPNVPSQSTPTSRQDPYSPLPMPPTPPGRPLAKPPPQSPSQSQPQMRFRTPYHPPSPVSQPFSIATPPGQFLGEDICSSYNSSPHVAPASPMVDIFGLALDTHCVFCSNIKCSGTCQFGLRLKNDDEILKKLDAQVARDVRSKHLSEKTRIPYCVSRSVSSGDSHAVDTRCSFVVQQLPAATNSVGKPISQQPVVISVEELIPQKPVVTEPLPLKEAIVKPTAQPLLVGTESVALTANQRFGDDCNGSDEEAEMMHFETAHLALGMV
eukprot:TRINITY_DN5093_c1_g1_i1.p1 TRINITY_DN5093_c1_g1~~TRINITY_DN5093_c1_g1_i1.p1  ORF type:complete len:458 (+),score=62.85 TRINITY_DN5093_c1_g1_i1:582-1955(+)